MRWQRPGAVPGGRSHLASFILTANFSSFLSEPCVYLVLFVLLTPAILYQDGCPACILIDIYGLRR